jgi:hypothetical protein
VRRTLVAPRATLLAAAAAALIAGCGFDVQSPDLFVLTRVGQGRTLTLLVNDGGTIRCDGGRPRRLADPLLLRARDLAASLDGDAKRNLRIPAPPNSAFHYSVKLQDGTIAFPDTAAARHAELGQVQLFAVQAAQQACGLPG